MIQAAFDAGGIDAICELFAKLEAATIQLTARAAKLEARITELEKRLSRNSSNSSKPPSSDGLHRKTKSLRPNQSGRKPGGQAGHPGQTLRQSETPDFTRTIPLVSCPKCHSNLTDLPVVSSEKRQVFDLPATKLQVTEHQAEQKNCPHCSHLVAAIFPENISAPAQYGPAMQAAMTYLNVRQVIPCARVAELCQDLFGHRPSAGSVVQAVAKCADRLAPHIDKIRNHLTAASVLHADETGVRCEGKTHWLHVVSNATHSLYSYSPNRGVEGFKVGQVLTQFCGTLVHDFWKPYDLLDCDHSRCNAHLLRELTAFSEDGHHWAKNLITALLEMKKTADAARANGEKAIASDHRARLQKPYDDWFCSGLAAHPEQHKPLGKTGQRGRLKQSPATNLLRRLRDKREEVLRFMNDLTVPFDNNQAERDLRMIKVQQKVSGCFRSEEGAQRFCVISSYISTIRKQGLNLIDSLKTAFCGSSTASPC